MTGGVRFKSRSLIYGIAYGKATEHKQLRVHIRHPHMHGNDQKGLTISDQCQCSLPYTPACDREIFFNYRLLLTLVKFCVVNAVLVSAHF